MSLADQLKPVDNINKFEVKITSMISSSDGVQVSETGKVERYGKVWLTYNFKNNLTHRRRRDHLRDLDGALPRRVSEIRASVEGAMSAMA